MLHRGHDLKSRYGSTAPLPSLKLTAKAPENRPKPKKETSIVFQQNPFLGAKHVSFSEGNPLVLSH